MRPKGLTVKDLIEALSKVEDQTMEVAVKDGFSSVWHDLYQATEEDGVFVVEAGDQWGDRP